MEDVYNMEPIRKDRPIKVAVTGAAGQIGYSLLPFICLGKMFGMRQKVSLHLLEITPAMEALHGVVMELQDCVFPLLEDIVATDDASVCFKDVDVAILVGSYPRKAGMERQELLAKNGAIFKAQGEALDAVASRDVKVLVVGNPANTNAFILKRFMNAIPKENITALTRLDHNRTIALVASKLQHPVKDVDNVVVWGNHSSTQFPDVSATSVRGFETSVQEALGGEQLLASEFVPTIQKRGAAIIAARKLSSAMSAANASCDHIRDWLYGTNGRVVSMAVCSDGSYNIPQDVWFSFPVVCTRGGSYEVVEGREVNSFSQSYLDKTSAELVSERDAALSLFDESAPLHPVNN